MSRLNYITLLFFYEYADHRDLHSFPTRRSSDLRSSGGRRSAATPSAGSAITSRAGSTRDRKSTRLNSSHTVISYAVFCLKKKTDGVAQCSKCHKRICSDSAQSAARVMLCHTSFE